MSTPTSRFCLIIAVTACSSHSGTHYRASGRAALFLDGSPRCGDPLRSKVVLRVAEVSDVWVTPISLTVDDETTLDGSLRNGARVHVLYEPHGQTLWMTLDGPGCSETAITRLERP